MTCNKVKGKHSQDHIEVVLEFGSVCRSAGPVVQFAYIVMCSFLPAGSFDVFDLSNFNGRAAVHDRDTDVDFGHLTIWIS